MTSKKEEIPADILSAQEDCVRRGWITVHQDGRITITKKGKREIASLFPMLDQTDDSLAACLTLLNDDPAPERSH